MGTRHQIGDIPPNMKLTVSVICDGSKTKMSKKTVEIVLCPDLKQKQDAARAQDNERIQKIMEEIASVDKQVEEAVGLKFNELKELKQKKLRHKLMNKLRLMHRLRMCFRLGYRQMQRHKCRHKLRRELMQMHWLGHKLRLMHRLIMCFRLGFRHKRMQMHRHRQLHWLGHELMQMHWLRHRHRLR